jgi:hypothetical protein
MMPTSGDHIPAIGIIILYVLIAPFVVVPLVIVFGDLRNSRNENRIFPLLEFLMHLWFACIVCIAAAIVYKVCTGQQ